ncbi:DUF2752 domain-containing protein [Alkaliphilus peptidifermentans]|uniref:DUF2752 domain-containing protein n=1 Tax=Alkaliphilus peptidifermentans DSM 18978 TaxID=1120976 RepID=A0A1G5K8K8_9FIRM|nr:DUF2752 domain-containing protein [Alkaliphilus peptidifermentans]SCY96571.1 Protein of unknown function [Alkaliphilus peptidifermentans DSM 18978]
MRIRKNLWFVLTLGICGLVFVYFSESKTGAIFPCVFNKLTGLYCSGCGMTRAVHSILHFKLYQAFRFNMLLFIFSPFLLLYFFHYINGEKSFGDKIIYAMLIVTLIFGILRNIPAFSWLAPTVVN